MASATALIAAGITAQSFSTFPPQHSVFFCRSDPAHPPHTHTRTHTRTPHDSAVPEKKKKIHESLMHKSAASLLQEEQTGKKREGGKKGQK